MASLFLSYSREDGRCVEKLAHVLESAGHEVWWDRHIASGREFTAEIEQALNEADVILVAWSKHSAKSPWVRDEAATGRDSGRMLPLVIDGSQPPLGFRQFQAFDLTGWTGRGSDARTTALIAALEAHLSGARAPQGPGRSRAAFPWLKVRWIAAAAILMIAAAAVTLLVLRPGRAEAEPTSLAVLPFKNMSAGDPYFAEGVAEEISNQLAREPQFKVAGRTSSALFKDAADVRDVGRRLHVAHILEGSVRSAGNQVRVDVSLIDARKGRRLWSQNFRGSLDDIFAIQESIGKQVATNLKRQLVQPAGRRGPTKTRGDVYELSLTARSLIRTREPAKLATAVELLERAVKLDPNYAPAWARLAQASLMKRAYGPAGNALRTGTQPDELAYARRAIALAPELAEARAVMWLLLDSSHFSEEMKRRGRAEIERAVELDPKDAQNWYWLFLKRQRDDLDFEGALLAGRKAAEIDPFFVFNQFYTDLAWAMGEREAVVRFLRNWAKNHPEADKREGALGGMALYRNDWSEVYQSVKKQRDLAPADMRWRNERGMGQILRRLGLLEEATRYLEPDFMDMWLGKPPSLDKLRETEPLDFWTGSPVPLFARVLINNRRAADLVSLYDRAFPSQEAMMQQLNKTQFVELAPIAASALREVGRTDEATRLVTAADRLCAMAMRKGQTPINFQVDCSRSWAMLGRRDDAIRTLERAMRAGWRPESGWGYGFVDEPVYRTVRDDPRLKRLGAFVLAENARERRELVNAGL